MNPTACKFPFPSHRSIAREGRVVDTNWRCACGVEVARHDARDLAAMISMIPAPLSATEYDEMCRRFERLRA